MALHRRTSTVRGRALPVLATVAVLLATGSAAACSSGVVGTPRPVDHPAAGPLGDLLVDASAFPEPYRAIVLPPSAVAQAAPDLTGVPPGARVDPAGCKPPAQDYGPDGTAMVVGTDAASRATVTVELVRTRTPLAELAAQLTECPTVTTSHNGVDATVTTVLTPPPPADADATLALRRTVTSGNVDRAVTQSMLTLLGQIGDVRVQATAMSFGSDQGAANLDTTAVDELFTAALARVSAAR
ncbi:sensor domain-containing protein [Prescottella sp. R16]|uniref:sensor domain-containing protein n=1 Tax=Prescottella sp. R16 TaxID=3064529 RepID=UPI00272DF0BE|nr:sensor domain-containing protein [Prescottella sp. R16]